MVRSSRATSFSIVSGLVYPKEENLGGKRLEEKEIASYPNPNILLLYKFLSIFWNEELL